MSLFSRVFRFAWHHVHCLRVHTSLWLLLVSVTCGLLSYYSTKNSSQETSVNRKQYSKWLIQMEHFSSPQVFVVSVFYDWQFDVPVHNTYLLWIQFLLPYLNLYLARRILVIPWSVPKMCCWVLLPSLGCSNRVAGQTFGDVIALYCYQI